MHFGLPRKGRVDVEATALTSAGRKIARVANVDSSQLARRHGGREGPIIALKN